VTSTPFNVGAFVLGAPTSPRALVRHADLLTAYADGTLAERGEDRESFLSHYVFGPELQQYFISNQHSVKGFVGPCRADWLLWDIDRDGDLDAALTDTCRLTAFIQEHYRADPIVWFSGSKGFHVAVELIHRPPPAVGFHRTARTFAENLAARAGVRIDTNIYDIAHLIRLPNTRHPKTGLFKRRIDASDLFQVSVDGIRRHAEHPAGDGLPIWRGDTAQLAADWQAAEAATTRTTEARAATYRDFRPDERAPRYLIEFLRFGVPVGERHMTLFKCSTWLSTQGAPPSLIHALLTEPGCDVGLMPKDVERQIRCGIEHAQKQRSAADPRPDPTADPDSFEAWSIRHENDPLPEGAMDFPFGALTPRETEGGLA
jgi:hypothetical protein